MDEWVGGWVGRTEEEGGRLLSMRLMPAAGARREGPLLLTPPLSSPTEPVVGVGGWLRW